MRLSEAVASIPNVISQARDDYIEGVRLRRQQRYQIDRGDSVPRRLKNILEVQRATIGGGLLLPTLYTVKEVGQEILSDPTFYNGNNAYTEGYSANVDPRVVIALIVIGAVAGGVYENVRYWWVGRQERRGAI